MKKLYIKIRNKNSNLKRTQFFSEKIKYNLLNEIAKQIKYIKNIDLNISN